MEFALEIASGHDSEHVFGENCFGVCFGVCFGACFGTCFGVVSEHSSELSRSSKEVFRSEIKMPSESYYDRDYWITLYQKFSNIKDKIYLKKLVKIDFKVQTSSPMRAWPAGPLLKITAIKQFFTPQVLKMLYFTATRET